MNRVGLFVLCASTFLGLFGCSDTLTDEEWAQTPLLPPQLTAVTPTEIRLGDEMVIIGKDFPHAAKGTMALKLNGTFVADDGQEFPYTGELPLQVTNPGVARFPFEVVIFHPNHDRIGTFNGMAQLVTTPLQGAEVAAQGPLQSELLPTGMRVGPSLLVRRIRPALSSCGATVWSTLQQQDLELEVQALGFGSATPNTPWEYRMIVNGADLDIRYGAQEAITFWPQVVNISEVAAPKSNHSIIMPVELGDTLYVNPSQRRHDITIDMDIQVGTGISGGARRSNITLTKFATSTLKEEESSLNKNLVIALNTGSQTIERVVHVGVHQQVQMGLWDGSTEVVERTPPVAVTGCARAGIRELQVNYDESYTLTLESAVGYREDVGGSQDAGITIGSLNLAQLQYSKHWNQTFSTDVQARISESRHVQRTVSSPVIPSYAYVWYRQETKYEHRAPLVYQNECGRRSTVGQAVFHKVEHAVQLDQGETCDPPSTMPPAIRNAQPIMPVALQP